jgi:streptogramin lyase
MNMKRTFVYAFLLSCVLALIFWRFTSAQASQKSYPGNTQSRTAVIADDSAVPEGTDPWGLTFDSRGNVWLALPGCDPNPRCLPETHSGKIAVYDPTKMAWVATYTLPADYGQAIFLTFDQHGKLWFPLFASNALGMFDPATKTFHKWTVPTPKSGPWDIVIDHQGYIWFTEHYLNKIARFDPQTETFTEIATSVLDSLPYGLTVDMQDNIWFTENSKAVSLIGEYTTQGALLEYAIPKGPVGNVTPHMIVAAPDGNIWWSEGEAGRIARLTVAQAKPGTTQGVTEYTYDKPCVTCNSHASGISIDHSGNIWFDDSLQGIFGSLPLSGNGHLSLYTAPTSYSHPHDGLQIDASNRLWFGEEYGNRLALAQTLRRNE